jgi:hypothetical protein
LRALHRTPCAGGQYSTLFAAGSGRGCGSIYRSTERGYSWTEIFHPAPPDLFSGGWFGQVAVAISASGQADVVFASYNGNLSPKAQDGAPLAPYQPALSRRASICL